MLMCRHKKIRDIEQKAKLYHKQMIKGREMTRNFDPEGVDGQYYTLECRK